MAHREDAVSRTAGQGTALEQDLVRTDVIAGEWGLAPKTLDNWRSRRVGPPYLKINGVIRYSRRACAKWLAEQNGGSDRESA